ncbi:MAG: type II CAAX endopeptidase family protein [Verrucomicrobiota bacterium]
MLPKKTWSNAAALQLMLGLFIILLTGNIAGVLLEKLKIDLSGADGKILKAILLTLFLQFFGVLWIHIFLRKENLSWREAFGFDSASPRSVITLAVVFVLIFLPLAWGLQMVSVKTLKFFHREAESQIVILQLQENDVSLCQQIFIGFMALISAPVLEELCFRGILYSSIKRSGYPKLAVCLSSILFGAVHLNEAAFLPLVLFAIVLIWLYELTGNLFAPILAHSCFNGINFLLLLLAQHFPALNQ